MFTVSPWAEPEGLPALRFSAPGADAEEAALNAYANSLTVTGRRTETGVTLCVLPCEAAAQGERSADFPAYDPAVVRAAADAVCAENGVEVRSLLETSVVRYYDRTGAYLVPAYRFCYLTAGTPPRTGS